MTPFEIDVTPKFFGATSQKEFAEDPRFEQLREEYIDNVIELCKGIMSDYMQKFNLTEDKFDENEYRTYIIEQLGGDILLAIEVAGGSTPISFDLVQTVDVSMPDSNTHFIIGEGDNYTAVIMAHQILFNHLVTYANMAHVNASIVCGLIDTCIARRLENLCAKTFGEETKWEWA